jgi:hypothetical protein
VLGTVKRIITRDATDADRTELDKPLHDLLEAKRGIDAQHERAKKASGKLSARAKNIDGQIAALHRTWKEPKVEGVVELRVERDSKELRLVRTDNGLVHFKRPLSKDERAALDAEAPTVVVPPEMTVDEAVAKLEERRAGDVRARAELVKPYTLDDAFAEVDAEAEAKGDEEDEDEAEADDKPKGKGGKGKRPGRGKADVNKQDRQTDMPFDNSKGGKD